MVQLLAADPQRFDDPDGMEDSSAADDSAADGMPHGGSHAQSGASNHHAAPSS